MTQTNPLQQYFRTPGLHISLPSRGAFTPPDEIEYSITGEIAIYPMTARDEVWSKNPDGLLNGYSIENIIKSCAPGIKNPRRMPTQDIDYMLLAIKKATYGDKMAITAKCPKCGNVHDYEISIDEIMATAKVLEPEYSVRLSDELVAKLRPYDYAATTRTNLAAFEESKLLQALVGSQLADETRIEIFSNSFDKISSLNLDLLADCVQSIISPSAEVTERDFIKDFIENAPKQIIKALSDGMEVFKDTGIDRKISLTCNTEGCEHNWITELQFDPAHFFA